MIKKSTFEGVVFCSRRNKADFFLEFNIIVFRTKQCFFMSTV